MAREAVINFAAPYLIYVFAQPHIGDVYALMASSGPPLIWSTVEFLRARKIDALSVLVLLGIALSLIAFYGGGGARFLQLREKLVTAIIGAVFLGSAAIGKPLIYQLARATLARRNDTAELERLDEVKDHPMARRTFMIMTVAWGFGLLADAALSAVLVFMMPISTYLIVNRLLGYGTMGLLFLWTFWYARRRRRMGDAMRAASGTQAG
ncbi:MAG: hypothetical protein JOZ55_07665 [Alphaproteobacteria bacterium]|nr:hypothetical protein [Alphaproteobacteria bacterium]